MDSNSEYTNRLNRAKEISNSINPKKTTKTRTLTQEKLRQSEENGKYFMDLIDGNVDSNNEENNSSQIVDSSSNVNENANINLTPEQQKEIENKVKEASNVQAPSSKKTEISIANNQEEKKNWLQANEFQNGYQFGDIYKTILGTGTDIVQDLATGILSPIENVFDIGTNVVATVQNILGFKDAAKKTRDFADKNITLILGSYFDTPFGESDFDAAVSVESLHHFTKEEKVPLYAKLHKSLKGNGYFILTDYFSLSDEEEFMHHQNLIAIKAEQGIKGNEFYHYDTPLTVKHETEALFTAGFSSVEVLNNWGATYTLKAIK